MATRDTLLLNGPITGLSSFALINRHLAAGLEQAGYEVWCTEPSLAERRTALPDICLTHGHPYDTRTAPGRINLFFLEYDYARLTAEDQHLAAEINARFDLCLVPSRFVAEACRASGVEIPTVLCPLGVDSGEFHPAAPAVTLPTTKSFRFVYVGGATERKGIDRLVEAYAAELTAADDVVLVLKTFSYEHLQPWFREVLSRVPVDGPQILHVHGDEESVAGYFTAADCGVFPFRGEGFALPVLECLASGTPVIVTEGGGPTDYCSSECSVAVHARAQVVDGKSQLEPDLADLRRQLRAAYEQRGQARDRSKVAATVEGWTWERTVSTLVDAIETCRAGRRTRALRPTTPVVHVFGEKGVTSWKKVAAHLDSALQSRFAAPGFDQRSPIATLASRVVVAHSGFALESFWAAAEVSASPLRVLVRGNGPFESLTALVNEERSACGLEPRVPSPIETWRHRQEETQADVVLVHSQATARRYVAQGRAQSALRVVPLGFTAGRPRPLPGGERLRFLFLGTDPLRKGLRVLLDAWNALRPGHAELICLVDTEVLRSPRILRHLVRNPNLHLKPLVAAGQVAAELDQAHCQVLPSFDDGFGVAIADGMGRGVPAIVSDQTGVAEWLTHGEDGMIVPAGSADALCNAIAEVCDNRRRLDAMSRQAFATAVRRPWSLFESEVADVIAALFEDRQ